jgi:hypothetical protein
MSGSEEEFARRYRISIPTEIGIRLSLKVVVPHVEIYGSIDASP